MQTKLKRTTSFFAIYTLCLFFRRVYGFTRPFSEFTYIQPWTTAWHLHSITRNGNYTWWRKFLCRKTVRFKIQAEPVPKATLSTLVPTFENTLFTRLNAANTNKNIIKRRRRINAPFILIDAAFNWSILN